MNERNKGRFGVKTNQTLKFGYTPNLEKDVGCVFQWVNVDEYERQHLVSHSLNKHRRWELLSESSNDEPSSFEEKQERKEKNKEEKKDEFSRKTDKSKHSKRQERKEVNKQLAKVEKQKELEKQLAQKPAEKYDDKEEQQVKTYNSGREVRENLHMKENSSDLHVYVPESREVKIKTSQSRHREKYIDNN